MKQIKLTGSELCSLIRESVRLALREGIEFQDDQDEYGGYAVNAYYNGHEVGYLHYYICTVGDICSNIAESVEGGEDIAYDVARTLSSNQEVIDLADIAVDRNFRNLGFSKKILEHMLDKFKGYQFYLRVSPTDGVDRESLANSVMNHGFLKVAESDDGGIFLIKR